jgi:hypothetical protein
VFGLWQAASVLARSTVETALREKVSGHRRHTLAEMIEIAVRQRVLTGHAIEAVNVVKVLGDQAVHGEAMKEQSAKKLVMCVREVVIHLFGGRMGDESRP